MDSRTRYHATVRFEPKDHAFQWEMGPYEETLKRWRREGLRDDAHWSQDSGYDRFDHVPVHVGLVPGFEWEKLRDEGDYEVYRDGDGVIKRRLKDEPPPAMPQYLDYPLKGRDTWPQFAQRLDPTSPARLPLYWDSLRKQYAARDFPLAINAGSLYGWLRN